MSGMGEKRSCAMRRTKPTRYPKGRRAPRPHLPTLDQIKRRYVEYVLDQCGGCQAAACDVLDIGRRTLEVWMKAWEEMDFLIKTMAEEQAEKDRAA